MGRELSSGIATDVAARSWLAEWPSDEVVLQLADDQSREVLWGQPWQYGTAAYWVELTRERSADRAGGARPHRLGETLTEEIVACLLGGHGITYEMNVAAFDAIRRSDCLTVVDDGLESRIADVISAPLPVGDRRLRYRFPNQKAKRIAQALNRLERETAPSAAESARAWLMGFTGIGPKTASWIVRNQYEDSDVAIVDIHVQRAGVAAGVFDATWDPARHYWVMEAAFLEWARHGEVSAADLDAVIWREQASRARNAR